MSNKAEIIISGSKVNSRVPDITVFSEQGLIEISESSRSTITLDMLPPLLVVEVVAPGKANRDRDYRYKRCSAVLGVSPMSDYIKKRSEYAARGIAYYWIVDPLDKQFVCLELVDGLYEEQVYKDTSANVFTKPFNLEVDLKQLF